MSCWKTGNNEIKKSMNWLERFIYVGLVLVLISYMAYQNIESKKNNCNTQSEIKSDTVAVLLEKIDSLKNVKPKVVYRDKEMTEYQYRSALYEKEIISPKRHIYYTKKYHDYSIFGKYVSITIQNTAFVTGFYDFEFEISHISPSGTVIAKERKTLYQVVKPQNSISEKLYISDYDQTDDVEVELIKVNNKPWNN